MKTFFKYIALYLILVALVTAAYVGVIYLDPDLVDDFYYRVTTPKENSLILGGSRAAQGIRPSIVNDRLCSDDNEIINHAFALGLSSVGPNYLRGIKQKLKQESRNGIFIFSVNPWTVTTSPENSSDDSTKFYEVQQQMFLGNLKASNVNPNMEYLFKYWGDKFSVFENAFKKSIGYKKYIELHSNGWLEVSIPMDSASNNARIKRSTIEYSEKKEIISNTRFLYLEKMIEFLQDYGQVFLVRLPVSKGMAQIEENKFPDFDNRMQGIAGKYNVPYINMIGLSGRYLTIDTHHIWKGDTQDMTHSICDSIAYYRSRISYKTELLEKK
jgi:hypothetical protein